MQPQKVMFFAPCLTSNITTMLVRNLVHGYKHDSATGFVCFACFPLSFGCPRIFCQGSWSWCVSWHFFLFLLHWGQLGSRGGILSLCFKDRSQSSFHAGWGGGEYWKLGSCPLFPFELFPSFSYWKLIVGLVFLPTWIISIFSSECWGCLAWISPVRQGGNRCFTWLSPSEAGGGGGNIESSCCLSCKDGAPYPCPRAKVNKWVFTFFI